MEEGGQRVVVVMDASRDVSPSTINGILKGLSLKPGDALKFLGVLHQVNKPTTLSFMGAGKILGYKIKEDSRSIFATNQKISKEEISKRREEYYNNEEIMNISRQCETEKVEFHVEVPAGSSLKMIAVKAIKIFNATSVILDRHIKKDKRYFLEKLSCRISRVKRDNSVEELRGAIPKSGKTESQDEKGSNAHLVTYDEMIPEMISATPRTVFPPKKSQNSYKTNLVEEQAYEDCGEPPWRNNRKSSLTTESNTEASRLSVSAIPLQEGEECLIGFAKQAVDDQENGAQNKSLEEIYSTKTPDEKGGWIMGWSPTYKEFRNSSCSLCDNTRPKIRSRRDFRYAELHRATDGFSSENYLSEGGFGSVFEGEIDGVKIAVKQHKHASLQGEKEFKSEVQVLTKARHENLVILLGSCAEGNHRLLVYEYVCNGSLDQHLSRHAQIILSWENRLKIADGAAKGLQYLHANNIIHRDMRPNNILVTHDYEPLLGDFGLARTTQCGDTDNSDTGVVGTLGYLAPEYAECGRVSKKTDVYSFGVVLLQLITGLKTTDKELEEKSLVGQGHY
ncbi:systemin receptor SR160-like isoform X2 [Mangifera indica]|uniref:systemin receptor SR160-like isoform X2 n=1 Tax=Mangifera indica TaxID=29780 RepID=UPI001CF9FCEB|nr:systemin receptor SR160-like isoform X2 [Mangifera indica]